MTKGRLKYWVGGTLSAFSGVAVVKWLAPLCSGNTRIAAMLGTRRTDTDES
jgi:hypothetical protein